MARIFKAESARKQYNRNNGALDKLYSAISESISEMIMEECKYSNHLSLGKRVITEPARIFNVDPQGVEMLERRIKNAFLKAGYTITTNTDNQIIFSW